MFYKRFTGHDFLQVVSYFEALDTIIREIYGPFDMITLLFSINDVIWWPFCFQNKDTITLTQAFLTIYILCKSDEASCNILGYRK